MKPRMIAISLLGAAMLTGAVIHFARADADDKAASQPASQPDAAGADKPTGTATIQTDTLKTGDLSQSIVAFGSVTAQPGEVAVFSVPYECRVKRINVTAGQPVDKAGPLLELEPSPAARLALAEAQSNLDAASKDLSQSQQRFDMKLATNSDLLASQQAVQLAQLRLDSLKQQGAGSDSRCITADDAGLVAKIDVQEGQIVSGGNPLVETIAKESVEVRIGVEPSDIGRLSIGQDVQLFPNNDTDSVDGKIRLITQRVNPDTRLVDVFVTPASHDALLLDGFVRAEITTVAARAALIAPRDAVFPDDDGITLFTVKDGNAVKHTVTIAAQNDRQTAIVSSEVHAGDTIVTQGNLELEDGMAVTTEEPK
jgi:RND family efflux transporter MFP subunit